MLGACGFLFWSRQRLIDSAVMKTKAVQKTEQHGEPAASLVEAFRGELLQLETDRSLGIITGEEYASFKQALEGTVKRALTRVGAS
jgi:PHD/YefM family antitoxin component YafN of YafNO toxin-antitoxin module